MNNGRLFIVLSLSMLAGCANHPAPVEQLHLTEQALTQAKAVGATESQNELVLAQDKLEQARAAFAEGDYKAARLLAEQAELDARLAEVQVLKQKSRKQLSELNQQIGLLRKQLEAL